MGLKFQKTTGNCSKEQLKIEGVAGILRNKKTRDRKRDFLN